MLSTTKNKFQTLYVLAAISIFALILAIMTYQSGTLPAFSAGQPAAQDSAALSPAEASTYRWQAIADFYTNQAATAVQYGPPGR